MFGKAIIRGYDRNVEAALFPGCAAQYNLSVLEAPMRGGLPLERLAPPLLSEDKSPPGGIFLV